MTFRLIFKIMEIYPGDLQPFHLELAGKNDNWFALNKLSKGPIIAFWRYLFLMEPGWFH
jgi:hypothetical protein